MVNPIPFFPPYSPSPYTQALESPTPATSTPSSPLPRRPAALRSFPSELSRTTSIATWRRPSPSAALRADQPYTNAGPPCGPAPLRLCPHASSNEPPPLQATSHLCSGLRRPPTKAGSYSAKPMAAGPTSANDRAGLHFLRNRLWHALTQPRHSCAAAVLVDVSRAAPWLSLVVHVLYISRYLTCRKPPPTRTAAILALRGHGSPAALSSTQMACSSTSPPSLPIRMMPLDRSPTSSGSPAWRAFTPFAGGPYPTTGRCWPVASIAADVCGQRPNHLNLSPAFTWLYGMRRRPPIRDHGVHRLTACHARSLFTSSPTSYTDALAARKMGFESPWFVHDAGIRPGRLRNRPILARTRPEMLFKPR
ncbi:hypothetical protein V8E36_001347 [Tilletia maclaganii]